MCHHSEHAAWEEIRERLLERERRDESVEGIEDEPGSDGRRERPGTPVSPADD